MKSTARPEPIAIIGRGHLGLGADPPDQRRRRLARPPRRGAGRERTRAVSRPRQDATCESPRRFVGATADRPLPKLYRNANPLYTLSDSKGTTR